MEEKIPIPNSNLTWSLKNKTLTISGTGAMPDYIAYYLYPWRGFTAKTVIIEEGVTTIGLNAFGFANMTRVHIPNSVTKIGADAFAFCPDLTSIYIPSSVTEIGADAFFCCRSLTKFTVKTGNVSYKAIDGVLFAINQDTLTLIKYPCAKSAAPYSIPNTVTTIIKGAFSDCEDLKGINIPNSVTTIGDYAFQKCTGLKNVRIPNSVTTIGNYVFFDCSNLKRIHIPNSVTTIGNCAFFDCSSLKRIHIPNSVVAIGDGAFNNCKMLSSISISAIKPPVLDKSTFSVKLYTLRILVRVPHQSVEAYKTAKVWSKFKKIVGCDDFKEEAPLSDEDLAYNAY